MFKKFVTVGFLAMTALFTVGASGAWIAKIVKTDGGYRIGNPDAKVSLIEWVSYTCSHCAHFAKDGDGALQIGYVGTGKMTREIRHIVRDPVDLTAAMLADCGPASKFPQNHTALLLSQEKWLPLAGNATAGQRQRWSTGDYSARRRAIASDLGFYKLMERRGYRRTDVDRCLADDAKAKSLADNTQKQFESHKITGTPSFAINGVLLAGTHDWSMLEPQLNARFPIIRSGS